MGTIAERAKPFPRPNQGGCFFISSCRVARAPGRPKSRGMNSYESRFRVIVGEDFDPSQDLGAEQTRALSALIFGMPETQITRDGFFIQYEGWSFDQDIFLSVNVADDHQSGTRARCEPNFGLDNDIAADA